MENTTPNPVVEPAAQPAVEQPKKKKTGKILAIMIPVVVILIVVGIVAGILISKNSQYKKAMQYLEDGDLAEAIEIHQKLGDYKDLADEICDAAGSRCKKLLKKNDYARIVKLYKTISEYPEAVEDVNERIAEHTATLLDEQDYYTVLDMCKGLEESEAAFDIILEQINNAADEIWENIYRGVELYDALAAEGIYLDAMDANMVKVIHQCLEEQNYWDAIYYYNRLDHNEKAQQDATAAYVKTAKASMESGESWHIDNILYTLYSNDIKMEPLNKAIYDHACKLMENGEYSYARNYFQLLKNYVGEYADCDAKLEELDFYDVVEDLERYINYGWYSDAKYLVDSYTGEKHQILLDIYLAHCGDLTFVADLENALLDRASAAQNGTNEKDLIKIEEDFLSKYSTMPFYDGRLQELMYDYLSALEQQKTAAKYYYDYYYYDYYEFNYYWNLAAAERYAVLDQLNSEYGFGNNNEHLQSLLGISESLRQKVTAWYEIHGCLSYYLWGNGPYEEEGVYYLDVYNYTSYTFSIQVYEQFVGYDGAVLNEAQTEYVSLAPNQWYKIVIHHPGNSVDYWYIDWDIYNIYLDGIKLD